MTTPDTSADADAGALVDAEEVTPSEARRATARLPLRERRGMQALSFLAADQRPALQPGKGLGALFLPTPRTPAPPVLGADAPGSRHTPPAPRREVADGLPARVRLEVEWLAAPGLDDLLHHADPTLVELTALAEDEQVQAPAGGMLLTRCGQLTPALSFPGPWQRTRAGRCPACCTALALPHGFGSPVNDDACRDRLGVLVQAVSR